MTMWQWVFGIGSVALLLSGWVLAIRKGWIRTANVLEIVLWLWPL